MDYKFLLETLLIKVSNLHGVKMFYPSDEAYEIKSFKQCICEITEPSSSYTHVLIIVIYLRSKSNPCKHVSDLFIELYLEYKG